jgi:hypothetical protein
MKCPKCGYEQPQSDECSSCGIILDKYNKRSVHTPPISRHIPSSSRDKSSASPIKTYIITVLAVFFLIYSAFNWWKSQPVIHGPGSIAPDPPKQTETETAFFTFKDHQIIPLADFHVNARVLSKKKYSFGRESDLSPIDLALGWGSMSDEAVLEKIKIKQSNRFYFWSVKQFPIPEKKIKTQSANMHLIPADSVILKQIKNTRIGDIVNFTGYLVKVVGVDGWKWKSSLTRNDTGNGACEVVYVEDFEIQ